MPGTQIFKTKQNLFIGFTGVTLALMVGCAPTSSSPVYLKNQPVPSLQQSGNPADAGESQGDQNQNNQNQNQKSSQDQNQYPPGKQNQDLPKNEPNQQQGENQNAQPSEIEATVHFDFDRSEIRVDDQALLDRLLQNISGRQIEKIRVTGYADRFGTDDYNMRLSRRRAMAVEDYLLDRSKDLLPAPLEPMLIEIFARGKRDPITNCPTDVSRDEQISCLQPDRRAEVEVVIALGRSLM